MDEKIHKRKIAVNLSDSNRVSSSIGFNWEITIQPRRKNIFRKIFSPKDNIEKLVMLDIKNLSIPEKLEYQGSLLTLVQGQNHIKCDGLPYKMKLTELSTTFNVFFNEQNLLDYKEPFDINPIIVPISFDLVCTDADGAVIDKTHVTYDIELTKIECEPKIDLIIEEEIQYDSQRDEYYIGDLIVESTANLHYAAPITVVGKLYAALDNISSDQLIVVKKDNEVVDEIIVENLSRNNSVMYSLYIKMSEMKNPLVERLRLDVQFKGIYRIGSSIDNKHLNIIQESIDILQDPQSTELVVTMDLPNGHRVFNNDLVQRPEYSFFALSNTLNQIDIYLSNPATDTSRRNAGLKILNLGIEIEKDIAPGVVIHGADGRIIDLNVSPIFKIECKQPDIKNANGALIPNGGKTPIALQLLFSPAEIAKVTGAQDFHFTMAVKITFDYFEDRFGVQDFTQLERKTFTMTIDQPLFLQPNPQWLCVDYGSSAIVCLYKNEIIDLRAKKTEIMKEAILNEKLRKDDFEKDSKFLSSDIVLHQASEDSKVSSFATDHDNTTNKNYGELAVFLSPTSALYTTEALRLLPCLKLLVGNTWLPKNKYLEDYTYKYLKNGMLNTVRAEEDKNNYTSLLRVDQVFLQSYEALFRYYISSVVQNRDNINRLVLTYPNTYTPRHISTLRNLVSSAFPAVRKLEFVSESDAVAAYYLKHWHDYAESDADFIEDERILVYDMGAGTLDISYIYKHQDANEHLTMEIKGKIGTMFAGNYLDFVLAQIVSELCDLESSIATTDKAIDEDELKKRTELKLFVKTEVKPKLKESNSSKKLKYNNVPFSIQQVLNHQLFNDYLESCTTTILSQLVNYMESTIGSLPIDTVVLSGRSCLLEPLQERLKENISNIAENGPRFVILDNPIRNIDGNKERQKAAVAEGAMEIANNYRRANSQIHVKSRRHYASFGIAYEKPGGMKAYCEILNHCDIPDSESSDSYTSKSKRIDRLNNVNQLVLIQTYLSAEDTEAALNRGDYQFVSEMEVIDTQTLGSPSSIEPKLCMDETNDIIVYFGTQRTRGKQPLGEDLQSEETKRSIWPFTTIE